VYVLPLDPQRVLVEDTRYSDGPLLDRDALRARVHEYIASQGWRVRECLREEQGVLPIALAGDIDAFWQHSGGDVPRSGLRAALFHPTTGYSLPGCRRARRSRLVAARARLGVSVRWPSRSTRAHMGPAGATSGC
jgi:lycopene beta-cyclase